MRDYRRPNPTGVLVIILVNVLVFILTELKHEYVFDGLHPTALHLGLNADTLAREPWTILTNCFVHYNFWHILGNMVTLYFFGTYLTQLVGERKFLATYILGGLAGSAVYLLWVFYAPWSDPIDRQFGVLAGASGAVYAVGGALAILQPNVRVLMFFVIPMPLWVAVIGGFVVLSLLTADIGISWQAHLGGLLVGLAAGLYFRRRPRERNRYLL